MGMSFGVLIVGVIVQLTLGTFVSSFILRAACALYNKLFGQGYAEPVEELTLFDRKKSPPVSDENPYRATVTSANSGTPLDVVGGVTVPDLGRAFGIMFFSNISGFVFSFLLGLAIGSIGIFGQDEAVIVALVSGALAGLTIQSLFISNMLPTTLGRAIAISIFMLMIGVVMIAGIALVAGGFGALVG